MKKLGLVGVDCINLSRLGDMLVNLGYLCKKTESDKNRQLIWDCERKDLYRECVYNIDITGDTFEPTCYVNEIFGEALGLTEADGYPEGMDESDVEENKKAITEIIRRMKLNSESLFVFMGRYALFPDFETARLKCKSEDFKRNLKEYVDKVVENKLPRESYIGMMVTYNKSTGTFDKCIVLEDDGGKGAVGLSSEQSKLFGADLEAYSAELLKVMGI